MNCKECAKQFTCKKKEEIENYGMIVSDIEECKDKIKFSEAEVFEPEKEVQIMNKADECEYCEKGKGICKENRNELGIELHTGSGYLVAYGLDKHNWGISVQCKINYCPMCGRKLGE